MLFSKLTTAMGVVAHDALLHFLRVVLVAAGINTVLAIVVLLHAQLPLAFAGAASEPPTAPGIPPIAAPSAARGIRLLVPMALPL